MVMKQPQGNKRSRKSPAAGRAPGAKAAFRDVAVVLMAGGAGVRFWPLSTPERPKQFLEEFSEQSLFAQAADRARRLVPPDRIMVATSEDLAPYVRRQAPDVAPGRILVEPLRRDTAAALIYAALVVERRWPGSVIISTPSDHFISPTPAFRKTMAAAVARARLGGLGTVGIRPAFAATEFGYLRLPKRPRPDAAQPVEEFVEKPDARTAARYLASGRYLWNSGIFVWRADALLDAARQHLPETHGLLAALVESWDWPGFARKARKTFEQIRPISIDYGIMEKTDDVWCVPGAFEWNDVGNWLAVGPLIPADAHGNHVRGHVFLDETQGTVVVGRPGHPIIVAGLTDCVVVETASGTLVCHKSFVGRLRPVIGRVLQQKPRKQR
jgi:mannose-1-phosphate guanylyltransferase